MADIGPFISVPLIFEGPSGTRHPAGRVVLESRTYKRIDVKLFHENLMPDEWKALLQENR